MKNIHRIGLAFLIALGSPAIWSSPSQATIGASTHFTVQSSLSALRESAKPVISAAEYARERDQIFQALRMQCYSRTNVVGHWVKDHAGMDHCCSMDAIAAAVIVTHPSVYGFDAACCWRDEFWGPDGRCMKMQVPPVFKIDPLGPITR